MSIIMNSSPVTPASIVTATGQMTEQQATDTRENLGAEPEKFVVTVTDVQDGYTADKTFAEIEAAYEAGKTVIVRDVSDGEIEYNLVYYDENEAQFSYFYVMGRSAFLSTFYIYSNDTFALESFMPEKETSYITITSTTPSITPVANIIYNCTASALTSLTITDPPATGEYSIVFTSGSTPTTTTIPSTILGLESFAAEANTLYEINVLDNRAVVGSWAVSSS